MNPESAVPFPNICERIHNQTKQFFVLFMHFYNHRPPPNLTLTECCLNYSFPRLQVIREITDYEQHMYNKKIKKE